MTNKGQNASMANVEGRLGDKKISSDAIMHPEQPNTDRTLGETDYIPMQILLNNSLIL
jgi:hypothetical protein